jgi:hypothetical protein
MPAAADPSIVLSISLSFEVSGAIVTNSKKSKNLHIYVTFIPKVVGTVDAFRVY